MRAKRAKGAGQRAKGIKQSAEGIVKNKRCWEAGKSGRWEAFIVHILRYTLKSDFRSLSSVF